MLLCYLTYSSYLANYPFPMTCQHHHKQIFFLVFPLLETKAGVVVEAEANLGLGNQVVPIVSTGNAAAAAAAALYAVLAPSTNDLQSVTD